MRKYFLVAAFSMIFSLPASAQWAVIDGANLKQSIMNTLSTLEQEITSAQALINQYQQLDYDYRQLMSLANGVVDGINGLMDGAQGTVNSYVMAVKELYGDVSNAKIITDDIFNRVAASGLSPEEWMKRETEVNQASKEGVGFLSDYQASVLNQVDTRYQEVKKLQSEITKTEGMHQSMQLMNTQMNALLATTNQLVEQNAVLAQHNARNEAITVGENERYAKTYSEWIEEQKLRRENTKKKFETVGQ